MTRTAARPNAIRDVVVFTRNRPACLARCLERLLCDCAERDMRLHVFDDASNELDATANAEVIHRVPASHRHAIRHITRSDRAAWVDAILRTGRGLVAEDVARDSLLGNPDADITIGASRNSAVLSLLGLPVLMIDDDVSPPVRVPPGSSGGFACSSMGDPTEFHFFTTRAEAIASCELAGRGLLDVHESLLGRTTKECFEMAGSEPPDAFVEARIAMTSCGLAGDSGMGCTFYYALLGEPSRARWIQEWPRFCFTRDIVRAAPALTLAAPAAVMTANLGIDLRDWIPPFPATGRNEDGVMALVAHQVAPHMLIGHLPFVLAHEPPDPRAGQHHLALQTVRSPWASHVLMMCLMAAPRTRSHGDPAATTASIGRFLVECTDDPDAFATLVRKQARHGQELRIGRLEDALASRTNEPDGWSEYIRALLTQAVHALPDDEFHLPSDIAGPPGRRLEVVRNRVRGFGRLLLHWGALREVALEVQRRGAGLLPL